MARKKDKPAKKDESWKGFFIAVVLMFGAIFAMAYVDEAYATSFGRMKCVVAESSSTETLLESGQVARRAYSGALRCGEHYKTSYKGRESLGLNEIDWLAMTPKQEFECDVSLSFGIILGIKNHIIKNCTRAS